MYNSTYLPENNYNIFRYISYVRSAQPWEILFYGLKRKIISEAFVVHYAVYLLDVTNVHDDLTVELAGLLENEYHKITEILEKKLPTLPQQKQPLNEIWFYIGAVARLVREDLL